MHISKVDLNLFVVFDAIYTEGGVTRAGEKLNLTQPAISHSLGRLREICRDPLFVRQGHRMVPTPLARNLIEPVRRSLRVLETSLNEIDRFDPATAKRRFTIGLRFALESTVLPPLLRELSQRGPTIDIAAVRIDRANLELELSSGTLDVAIDVVLPLGEDIHREHIVGDRMIVVARRGHPEVGAGLDRATYLRQEHILVTTRRRGLGLEDLEISRLGSQRRIRLRCQQYFTACRIVSETDLILTMPERHAMLANLQLDNRILPLPLDGPVLDTYLYWHATADADPANQWLRKLLVRTFAATDGTTGASAG